VARTAARHWGALGPWDALRQPLSLPRRLLILGPKGLGDVIAVLPTLRMLQRIVKLDISWMGNSAHQPLVAMMGVSHFIPLDSEHTVKGFDALLAFHDIHPAKTPGRMDLASIPVRIGSASGAELPQWCNHIVFTKRYGWPRHEAQRNLRMLIPLGIATDGALPYVERWMNLRAPAVRLPADLPQDGYVVLHPFSAGSAREWPIAHWVDLATRLAHSGRSVVLTGSPAESQRLAAQWPAISRGPKIFDAFGRLDLQQLCHVLQRADSVVAASTGPLHLAAALGTPTLGLFVPRKGLTLDRWAPLGAQAVGVQAHRNCPGRRTCDAPSCACMQELLPQMVVAALPVIPGDGIQLQAIPGTCLSSKTHFSEAAGDSQGYAGSTIPSHHES
jgi:heptosyltransferase-3